nr:MAG TPA: hypothetical protein [Caudoviricetes sp.]
MKAIFCEAAKQALPPLHRFHHPSDRRVRRQSDAIQRQPPPWMPSHCRPAAF